MRSILIIEDDLIDQMAFTRMLDQQVFKFQYSIANSVKEAQKKLIENQFDLVISDLNLADGTTFDILDLLKNIPFVLISGNEDKNTVNSLIQNSGAIAFFTKDINLNYLENLAFLLSDFFSKKKSSKKSILPPSSPSRILQTENVIINLDNAFKVFDNKKEDVKETIELFIQFKPIEMDELYNSINNKNCVNVAKITHRMKSGYRFLGMKKQALLTEIIYEKAQDSKDESNCDAIIGTFKQLSVDTKIAIELLKKEIPFL